MRIRVGQRLVSLTNIWGEIFTRVAYMATAKCRVTRAKYY